MHNRHCEPPSELCCNRCSEVEHPFHPPGMGCVWASDADVAQAQAIARLAGRQPAPPEPECPVGGCGARPGKLSDTGPPMKCRGYGAADERCMATWLSIDPEDQGRYRDYLAWLSIEREARPPYSAYLDSVAGRQPATSGDQSPVNHWSNAAASPPSGTWCPSADAVRRAGGFDETDAPDPSLTTVLAAARHLARLWRSTDERTQAEIAIANTNVATALDRLAAVEPFAGLSADPGRVN